MMMFRLWQNALLDKVRKSDVVFDFVLPLHLHIAVLRNALL